MFVCVRACTFCSLTNSPPTCSTKLARVKGKGWAKPKTALRPKDLELDPLSLNPKKRTPEEQAQKNSINLMNLAQKFLEALLNSEESIPASFTHISHHLQQKILGIIGSKSSPLGGVKRRDTPTTDAEIRSQRLAVSGFFFLRFVCPAITSPEAHGLVHKTPSPGARRALVLVAKLLQNLASGVLFGQKEPHMCRVNRFIRGNKRKISDFYGRLCMEPQGGQSPRHSGTWKSRYSEDLDLLRYGAANPISDEEQSFEFVGGQAGSSQLAEIVIGGDAEGTLLQLGTSLQDDMEIVRTQMASAAEQINDAIPPNNTQLKRHVNALVSAKVRESFMANRRHYLHNKRANSGSRWG